ncbi:MAG: cyclase family protein [Actinomycetia bacterium]|nr:cyclase family protein [Actinomycetes bacterium]
MDVRELGKSLSNWGRWGSEDERGTTNLITPEALVAAAKLVRQGKVFDLGINFDSAGPQPGGARNNPVHLMSATGVGQQFRGGFQYADDYVIMQLQCATQWDGLAHVFYDDQLYNGFPASEVTPKGTLHNGIEHQGKGITGRGVLLDIAALHGVPWLDGGYAITPADLDAAAGREGLTIGSGDIVLFRTGWRRFFLETGSAADYMRSEPGLGLDCCEWLHRHEVAAVCSDNFGIEVQPPERPEDSLPVHMVLIRDMGMTLGEIFDLEELAADCEADGVWEFFFSAPVLKVTNGVGSPINPLALK